jgi:hypothetical protein
MAAGGTSDMGLIGTLGTSSTTWSVHKPPVRSLCNIPSPPPYTTSGLSFMTRQRRLSYRVFPGQTWGSAAGCSWPQESDAVRMSCSLVLCYTRKPAFAVERWLLPRVLAAASVRQSPTDFRLPWLAQCDVDRSGSCIMPMTCTRARVFVVPHRMVRSLAVLLTPRATRFTSKIM